MNCQTPALAVCVSVRGGSALVPKFLLSADKNPTSLLPKSLLSAKKRPGYSSKKRHTTNVEIHRI